MCGSKTRLKTQGDTELKNVPLLCPKCKQETLINLRQLNRSVIQEPNAQLITCRLKCGYRLFHMNIKSRHTDNLFLTY
ncbi:MAG TPA: cysteine-rich KTR domain-containing protein [Candidatus Merdibacter merdigallinarum]|nr:cysteine-rich KTR domain-containing protein [Candidatus Merdibacter merdigallinarum]